VFEKRDKRVAECTLGEDGNSTDSSTGCQVPGKVNLVFNINFKSSEIVQEKNRLIKICIF
jgi:hypothetical protein